MDGLGHWKPDKGGRSNMGVYNEKKTMEPEMFLEETQEKGRVKTLQGLVLGVFRRVSLALVPAGRRT